MPVAAILAALSLAGPANAKHNEKEIAQLLATIECPGCDLRHANLDGKKLVDADLRGADFRGARLREANLTGARLIGADFRGANLRGAFLQRNLQKKSTSLRGADLRGAIFRKANPRGALIEGAAWRGANLVEAIWIDGQTCQRGSIGECKTK